VSGSGYGLIYDTVFIKNKIRMQKSKGMRGARHVVRMGEKRNACKILVGKPD
jgi:hypothetical protein